MATTREELHHLIDELPTESLSDAARALEEVRAHSRSRSLQDVFESAPYDDEELSSDDVAAIGEGRRAAREGRVITDSELARRLGLPSSRSE